MSASLTSDASSRGLRFFGWMCLAAGILNLVSLAVGLLVTWLTGEAPDYNRFDRAITGASLLYISSLHFDLAKERS